MQTNDSSHASPGRLGQFPARVTLRGARRRRLAGGLAIVVATFVAYAPALRSEYVWDDDQYLTENHLVQAPGGLAAIWEIRHDREAGRLRVNTPQYYPLVYTSYWLEHRAWGFHPVGYHVVNVLLHAISSLLVWRIARRLGIPAGWFIAAVFALHPVQVESVAWVTERKNVLSGLFYLLALSVFLRFFDAGRARWYLVGLLLFFAALLSKTVTCTLPVVILLARWHQRRRIDGRDIMLVTPILILGVLAGLFTAYLERSHVGASGAEWSQTFLERALIVAPRALLFYARKIAWPHPLVFIYPRWEVAAGTWASYLPLAAVLAVVGAALAGARRFGRGPLLLLAYAGVTLFPALGFFEVYPHRFSWVADHFQYLGSLGFITLYTVIIAWLAARVVSGPKAAAAARAGAIGLLVVLSGLTFRQSRSYQDAERLWRDTLSVNPDAWIASLNLGILASKSGHYDRAAEYFQQTARHPAARSEAYGSWGNALLRLKRVEGAIGKFEQSLAADPGNAGSYVGLATAYGLAGRLDRAEEALEKAARLDPERLSIWLNLALLRARQQRWDQAERCLERARALSPYDPAVRQAYQDLRARRHRD